MTREQRGARNLRLFGLIFLGCVALAGCAAGDARFTADDPAGFWQGLWHGLISCVTFLIGLFSDKVEIYERNNNGSWYDLGFLVGIGLMASSGKASRHTIAWKKNGKAGFKLGKGSAKIDIDVSWDDSKSDAPTADGEPPKAG